MTSDLAVEGFQRWDGLLFFLSPRQTTDCGKNGGGFSGREPALSHSRLTATERLWLINADVLIDHRQLSPGRRAFSPQQEKKGQINNWGREELRLHSADLKASFRRRRSFAYPPSGFVWFCLLFFYLCIYLLSTRLSLSEEIQQRTSSDSVRIIITTRDTISGNNRF